MAGACNGFFGACVVYGPEGSAPYTTTVYESTNNLVPTTIVTSTVIPEPASTTSSPNACADFTGACVVYGTNTDGAAQYTTTAYHGGGNGNGQGVIGAQGDGDGYIGAARRHIGLEAVQLSALTLVLATMGFAMWT